LPVSRIDAHRGHPTKVIDLLEKGTKWNNGVCRKTTTFAAEIAQIRIFIKN
jgi:hypothetical protein